MVKKKLFVLVFIFFITISHVCADSCYKNIPYQFKWCLKSNSSSCIYTQVYSNVPDLTQYYFDNSQELECGEGWIKQNGKCYNKSCDTTSDVIDNFGETVVLNGECSAEKELTQTLQISSSASSSYTTNASWCPPASINGSCQYILTTKTKFKFYFENYGSQPIISLVKEKFKNQYAPGTGVDFTINYESDITYSLQTVHPTVTYYTGYTTRSYNGDCPEEEGGDCDGWTPPGCKPGQCIPRSCASGAVSCHSSGCDGYTTCYYCTSHTVTASCSSPTVTIESITSDKVDESSVVANTKNIKLENEYQNLGSFQEQDTTYQNVRQRFVFTPPQTYINIKTGDVKYQNIDYNGGSNNVWKEINSGYYIPVNALSESVSKIDASILGKAYVITLGSVSRYSYVDASLSCPFNVKLSGCPYEDCGDANCNPNTDKYKCCRNTSYLQKHPDYYGKVCENQDNYIYRQISLTDPFPSRDASENWYDWINDINNQKKLASSFEGEADYTLELTNSLITRIRQYNDIESNVYTLWNEMNDDGSSNFLKEGTSSSISLGNNLSINSTYYSLGCGPSNVSLYSWCN